MPTDLDDDFDLDDLGSETPDDSDLVRDLRRQLRSKTKEVNRLKTVEEENKTLKRAQALSSVKLPDDLTDRQRKALIREIEEDGRDVTPELVREIATEMGHLRDEVTADLAEHEQIDNASSGSRAPKGGVITPADVAGWSSEKWMDFKAANQEAAEELKRGNEVRGVTF